eukprot:CAMPEP_0172625632 /NCGR_PEP_ID=MMETSP1068-20121228/144939_1 /TAXON_ID=35684 /ORGANISM="Pseudopedinella elastica, Strain CCMP716" /LENGTH=134 /DNA_ID=CAMNT_0013434981 /DNA_START=228 /DNA_END=631 /DNA_ORIENTATION=-
MSKEETARREALSTRTAINQPAWVGYWAWLSTSQAQSPIPDRMSLRRAPRGLSSLPSFRRMADKGHGGARPRPAGGGFAASTPGPRGLWAHEVRPGEQPPRPEFGPEGRERGGELLGVADLAAARAAHVHEAWL